MINFFRRLFKLEPKSKPEIKSKDAKLDEHGRLDKTFEFFKEKLVDNPVVGDVTLIEAVKKSQTALMSNPNEFVKGFNFDSTSLDTININSLPEDVKEKILAVINESKVKNTVE